MTYTVYESETGEHHVRDGSLDFGFVEPAGVGFRAFCGLSRNRYHRRATLPTLQDAIEWLLHEHHETPLDDRPEAQRVKPLYHP